LRWAKAHGAPRVIPSRRELAESRRSTFDRDDDSACPSAHSTFVLSNCHEDHPQIVS
jgi:hypothetical protein